MRPLAGGSSAARGLGDKLAARAVRVASRGRRPAHERAHAVLVPQPRMEVTHRLIARRRVATCGARCRRIEWDQVDVPCSRARLLAAEWRRDRGGRRVARPAEVGECIGVFWPIVDPGDQKILGSGSGSGSASGRTSGSASGPASGPASGLVTSTIRPHRVRREW